MPAFSFLCVEKMLVISQHQEENLTGMKLLQWWVDDEEVTLMTHGRESPHPEMLCPWLTAHPREDAVCLFYFHCQGHHLQHRGAQFSGSSLKREGE